MKYAIISDIHEDIAGLQRAITKIEKNKCDEIICLGDISGFSIPYYPHRDTRNAHECLKLLRKYCKIIIAGNHDLNAAGIIPDATSEFSYPENWYSMNYFQKKTYSKNKVWLYEEDEMVPYYTEEDLEFIKTLPKYFILEFVQHRIFFSHYLYPNISGCYKGFYHRKEDFSGHFDFMSIHKCNLGFSGHSHPERSFLVTENKIKYFGFRKINLSQKPVCVNIPSIAGNKRKNGFCIFDMEKQTIESKKI